jgi:glycosyltransferase involved in cell wall biosynthesis
LAYNEQKHIADTIQAILTGNGDMIFDVIVYANGCTDKTADVVRILCERISNLRLRELAKASKPNAWNTAFSENANPILFFSDGDVRPEPGSVAALRQYFDEHPEASLVCSQFWPDVRGLTLEKHMTGFLQIPLAQDFHTGGFYAIRRSRVLTRLQEKGLEGIPEGVVGEDEFLEALMPPNTFFVAREKVFFEPPTFADYWKFFARIRWQEEQLVQVYGHLLADDTRSSRSSLRSRLASKLASGQGPSRLLIGLAAAALRTVVNVAYRGRIDRCYRNLGPVGREDRCVLSQATRSESTK